jgi:hypothetical protein
MPGQDIQDWLSLHKIINDNISIVDRSGVLKLPIRTQVAPHLIMPSYDPDFSMTYEECCQLSARELIARQERLDIPIRILYSGGIDSSLVLVSLIKELGLAAAEWRIELVMNMESIEENPWMWEKIIRTSKIRLVNGEQHSADWGKDRILVGGEFNDQLLGMDTYKDLVRWRGEGILIQPWTETIMTDYFLYKGLDRRLAEKWTHLWSVQLLAAPCAVETVADWWWWLNFSCKWTSVYFSSLSYVLNPANINQDYLKDYYCQFFGSDDFQRWSMKDTTHKHKGTILSYKWHSKKLIAEFLGSPEFLQKIKRGSFWNLIALKRGVDAIDNEYNYIWKISQSEWYSPTNSFN